MQIFRSKPKTPSSLWHFSSLRQRNWERRFSNSCKSSWKICLSCKFSACSSRSAASRRLGRMWEFLRFFSDSETSRKCASNYAFTKETSGYDCYGRIFQDTAHLVVSTPGRLLEMLKYRPDFCSSLRHLVLDEADLLLSYGYEKEMRFSYLYSRLNVKCIFNHFWRKDILLVLRKEWVSSEIRDHLPSVYQCIMTSATLSDDMSYLKKIFMTGSVVTIKLKVRFKFTLVV